MDNGDSIDHSEYANGVDTIVMKSGKKFTDRDVTYKYAYINTKGEEVLQTQADDARNFKDGMATIFHSRRLVNDRAYFKIGWMDTTGKMVIPDHSEESWWFSDVVHDFDDGLVCYFKARSEGLDVMPSGGILDKTGKVIIPAEPDTFITGNQFGLWWKDGIIAVAPFCKTNENGQRDNNGKYWWQHLYLYDYSGRLIAKPEGYTGGYPLGGGYTLSMYQPLKNKLADEALGRESS
ncbi:MAG: WG repeat-containing protein, partial [Oscillospiraceae bacterium]